MWRSFALTLVVSGSSINLPLFYGSISGSTYTLRGDYIGVIISGDFTGDTFLGESLLVSLADEPLAVV